MKYILKLCLSLVVIFCLNGSKEVFANLNYDYVADESGFYFEKAHLTKDRDLLLFETKYRQGNEEFSYYYDYRIKLNEETLTFYNIVIDYITYEDEFYFLVFEVDRNQLTLYNEKLQIVSSDLIDFTVDSTNPTHEFTKHEHWIQLRKGDFNGNIENQFAYYDLKKKQVVNRPNLPAAYAKVGFYDQEPGEILLQDAFGQKVGTVSIKGNTSFIGYVRSMYSKIHDNKVLLLSSERAGDQVHYYINVWDLITQSTVDTKKVTIPYHDYNQVSMFDSNGKVKLTFHVFDEERFDVKRTDIYEYDLVTKNISNVDRRDGEVYYGKVTDSLFYETIRFGWGPSDYKQTIYNYNGQKMYEVTEDEYWRIDGDFMKIHNYRGEAKVYDLYSRKLLFELEEGKDVSYVNDEYYFALTVYNPLEHYKPTSGKLLPFNTSIETYAANKVWTVKLTQDIDRQSATNENVYVLDSKGQKVAVGIDVKGKYMYITAPYKGYTSGETYTLYVNSLKSTKGTQLKTPKLKIFTIQ